MSVTFRVDKRLVSNKLFEQLPKKGISKNFIVVAKIRKKHLYMKLECFFRKNNKATRIMGMEQIQKLNVRFLPCPQLKADAEKEYGGL